LNSSPLKESGFNDIILIHLKKTLFARGLGLFFLSLGLLKEGDLKAEEKS